MSEWKQVRLSDEIEIIHGYAFNGAHFSETGPGLRLVTPGNFAIGGGWRDGKLKYYRGPEPDGYRLTPGDLIITMTDLSKAGDTLGYPALVPPGGPFLHNQRIGLVRQLGGGALEKHFLYYLLRTRQYRQQVLATATGSTVRHTSPSRILEYECLVPPRNEQCAIVEILSALDDKIDCNERIINASERLLRAMFEKLLAQEQGGERRLTSDLLSNYRHGRSPIQIAQQTPYVGLEHMPRGSVVLRQCGVVADVTSNKFAFEAHDILFGKLRPYFRKVSLAFEGGVCSSDILVLRPRKLEYLPFALLFVSSQPFIDYCDGASAGTRMPRVSWQDMSRYSTNFPSDNELTKFNAVAIPALDRMGAAATESLRLSTLRDALLPRLLSGELRTREADALMEEAV